MVRPSARWSGASLSGASCPPGHGPTPCPRFWCTPICWPRGMAAASKPHMSCMSNTLLALSHKAELGLHARVVADVQAMAAPLGIALLITGAFARDLHLHYAWGVPVQRQTTDVDFAL